MTDREDVVKKATGKIADLLKEVQEKLDEAASIADEAQVDFSYGGPTDSYGFGGWYNPKKPENKEDWEEDSEFGDDWYESGWQSSSQSC